MTKADRPEADFSVPALQKTDAEWRAELSPEEYQVTRQCGTERAFTGEYWDKKDPGIYRCRCCASELFASTTKYDSGSGWPSFFEPVGRERIKELVDRSHYMVRTEIRCATCDAHLGHVFEDGPKPTGLRYCINSASLRFEPKA